MGASQEASVLTLTSLLSETILKLHWGLVWLLKFECLLALFFFFLIRKKFESFVILLTLNI